MNIIFTLLLFIFPFLLNAQTPSYHPYWNVTFHVGPFVSGLPNQMKENMHSQGYQPYKGFLGTGPPIDMTFTQPVFQLGIEKKVRHNWSGKMLISRTQGYIKGISSQEGDLKMVYQIFTSAFLTGFNSKENIARISLGPSINLLVLRGIKLSSLIPSITKNKTKIGLMVEAGCRFPRKSQLFFNFNTQYNYVGTYNFGTFLFQENTFGGQSPFTSSFEAGKHSFNYLSLNFGLGLRFGKGYK